MLLFIAYVLIGVLFWNHRQLRRDLERAMATAGPQTVPAPTAPTPAVVAETGALAMPPPLPVAEEPAFAPPALQSRNWEELIGGNLLNKLGALVLVIGIALFLSYSFARMGPAGRAITSLGVSGAILGGGLWLERKETYRIFSRGLIAAGWAGLYFTSYAMYAIEASRVIANPILGGIVMVAVAAAMVGHSLSYRVQSLSALAYGCVFGALALSDNSTFAVAALLPLALSILYLARRFGWNGLALSGAIATYGVFLTRPSTGAPLLTVQALLLVFWLLFEGFDFLRARTSAVRDFAMFGVNALAGLGASAALWYRMAPESMWQFCAAGAVLYLASAWLRFAASERSLWEAAATLSVALAALGIFAGVEGLWTSLAYIALAETVFFASMRVRQTWLRVLSLAAFGVAVLEIAARAQDGNWAVPVAVLGAAFYLNRYLDRAALYFGPLGSVCVTLVLWWEVPGVWASLAVVTFGAILCEIGMRRDLADFRWQAVLAALAGTVNVQGHELYAMRMVGSLAPLAVQWWMSYRAREGRDGRVHGWLAVAGAVWGSAGLSGAHAVLWWAALGLGLAIAGRVLRSRDLRWQSAAVAVLTAVAALEGRGEYRVLHPAAVVAWFLLAVVLEPRENKNFLRPAYGIAAAILGAVAIERGVSGAMLTLGWSLEGIALLAFGFPARERALRLAGLALLLGCIGKVFVYDLRNLETMYRILSFVGLGAVLIAVSFIYTRFRDQLRRYL